jgi:hypothetical protein
MSLRDPLTPTGEPKLLLSIQTRSIETARRFWSEADERDVGDLKLYWNWRSKKEVAAAKAAFEAAHAAGIRFFRLLKGDDLEGELIENWDQALGAPVRPGQPAVDPAQMASAGGRVQGIPRVSGG